MNDDLAIGLWQLNHAAHGDPYAAALRDEIIRLYTAARERVPPCLDGARPPAAVRRA